MTDKIPHDIKRQAEAAKALLLSINGIDDDTELTHDTIEGETSLMEALDAALFEIDDCEAIVTGCKAQSEVLLSRASKFAQRKDRVRALIEQAMLICDLPTAKRPTATITVKRTPPKPIIVDESLIPARFFKTPAPALDKPAVNAAVKEGENIPGVGMDNGGVSLQVRRL